MKKVGKRAAALFVALVMCLSLLPMSAFAAAPSLDGIHIADYIGYDEVLDDLDGGKIAKYVGDTFSYNYCATLPFVCTCGNVLVELVADDYAFPDPYHAEDYLASDDGIIEYTGYDKAWHPLDTDYPGLVFNYKAAKPGTVTAELIIAHNFEPYYETGWCNNCGRPVEVQNKAYYYDHGEWWYQRYISFDVTVNAKYVLNYDTQGGSSVDSTTEDVADTSADLYVTSAVPTKEGFEFKGWAETADATEATYKAGDTVTLTWESGATVSKTLYAVWEEASVNPGPDEPGDCDHVKGGDGYCTDPDCDHIDCPVCGGKDPGTVNPGPGPDDPTPGHVHEDKDDDGKCDDPDCGEIVCSHVKGEDGYCTEEDCNHPEDCTCGGKKPEEPKHEHEDKDDDGKCDDPDCGEIVCNHDHDDDGYCTVAGCTHDSSTCCPKRPAPVTPPTTGGGFFPFWPTVTPNDPGEEIDDPDVPLASPIGLNTDDHIAYITGYADGTVRPTQYITRAEVVTIFYRLMTDLYRTINWSDENDFHDVSAESWYNTAVSTIANAGLVNGYTDGSFLPNQNITRAEFATIAARLLDSDYTGEDAEDFTDTADHWANTAIRRVVEAGWVEGYEDGSFRPDQFITRAEAITVINRMLNRGSEKEDMLPDMKTWSDNPEGQWYYEAIQEATNEHEYERKTKTTENWTDLLDPHDWDALEKEWADLA